MVLSSHYEILYRSSILSINNFINFSYHVSFLYTPNYSQSLLILVFQNMFNKILYHIHKSYYFISCIFIISLQSSQSIHPKHSAQILPFRLSRWHMAMKHIVLYSLHFINQFIASLYIFCSF